MRCNPFFFIATLLATVACSSLSLEQANFAWPIESVLPVDKDGFVADDRYSLKFNAAPVFFEESQDSTAYIGEEVRLIRDREGYYYLTADQFKHVYIFQADEGELKLVNTISISETGIMKPAFNQRLPHIELIDANNKILNLSHNGIEGGI